MSIFKSSLFILLFIHFSPMVRASEYQLVSRWAVDIAKYDSPVDRYMSSQLSGLIVDGKYFYVATPRGTFEKRFLETGEKEWSTPLEGLSQATWTLAGDDLFGGDTKGNFYCLRATDGSVKWKATTKGVFFSKALVHGDQVWVSTSNGTLQSYQRETGQWLWQQADPQAATLSLWSAQGPTLFQGSVLAGFPSALLQAFDPKTGAASWKESFASNLVAGLESFNDLKSVTAKSEYLVASSFSGDLKVWKAQGPAKKLLWQKKLSLYSPVSLEKDGILVLSGRDGSVQSIDLESGFVKWKHELSSGLGSQPATRGDKVWVGSSTGEVYVFSKSGERLVKSKSIQSAIWNSPVLLNENEALILSSQGILRRIRFVKI